MLVQFPWVANDLSPDVARNHFDSSTLEHVEQVFDPTLEANNAKICPAEYHQQADILLHQGIIDNPSLKFKRNGHQWCKQHRQQTDRDLSGAAGLPDIEIEVLAEPSRPIETVAVHHTGQFEPNGIECNEVLASCPAMAFDQHQLLHWRALG